MKKIVLFFLSFLFIGLSSFPCRADVTLRTSSGQEVYLTDSQYQDLQSRLLAIFGNVNVIMEDVDGQYELIQEILDNMIDGAVVGDIGNKITALNRFFAYVFRTDTNVIEIANHEQYLNLSYISGVYSNLLSRYLTAYTNNLYSQISALDTSIFSTNYLRRWIVPWYISEGNAAFDIQYTLMGLGSLFSNVESLSSWWAEGITDTDALSVIYDSFATMIRGNGDSSIPLEVQQQMGFIGMQQFQNMYAQQEDYINRVTGGFTLGMFDASTGSVVPFGFPYFDNSFNDDYLQFMNQDFFDTRSFTSYWNKGTNILERIKDADIPDPVKKKMTDNIMEKLLQKNNLDKNDFEGLKEALQGMAEAMSNCCSNTGYLPLIYEGVSNLVEGVGNNQIGGGAGGSDSNGLSNLDFPLGFPPSETNEVPYTTDWVQYWVDNSQFGKVGEVEYSLNSHNQEEHNRKAENVGSNVVNKVIPIIDKFKTYSQGFSRSSPPSKVSVIDTAPLAQFARYEANIDIDFGQEGGILDMEWINDKICMPFHKFFTIVWLSLAAFLIIASWVFFLRKFMLFRVYLIKLWEIIKNAFT